ncbi:MAG: hypothetical protein ACRDOF_00035 [Gaiellaceae bacterium]
MAENRVGRRRLRLCLPAVLVALAVAGCSSDAGGVPTTLMDGSSPPALPVELEGVDQPTVLTRVRVVRAAQHSPDTASASCLRERDWGVRPAGSSVERIGGYSESVTFGQESRRGVFGCDNSRGAREGNRRWCGGAYGTLYSGRLRDPRLDLLCSTSDGERMAFVWVEPQSETRYVSVVQPRFTEVYEVAGELPVRVATTNGVSSDPLSATFDLVEHDVEGRLVRRYQLDAVPAG